MHAPPHKEEDEPHHHGECGIVQPCGRDVAQELAFAIEIRSIEGLHEHLDRTADLVAELVGDLLLEGDRSTRGFDRVCVRHREEATHAEQRIKAAKVIGSCNHRPASQRA